MELTKDVLLSLNDPLLAGVIEAADEGARSDALAGVLIDTVQPIIHRVIRRYSSAIASGDVDDMVSAATIRVMRRINDAIASEEDAIASIEDYVVKVTYNAIYDSLRKQYPERTRLKNRLRFLLTHDARFAVWDTRTTAATGLAAWKGNTATALHDTVRSVAIDRDAPLEGLAALFRAAGAPLLLDDVVRIVAAQWHIRDARDMPAAPEQYAESTTIAELESRQYLQQLWREIRQLKTTHRAALLLNLRDADHMNALSLLLLVGVATFEEIAAAIGFTVERLAHLWNDLPVDDLRIASILGTTRQQVINMRKAARRRLTRRMSIEERRP